MGVTAVISYRDLQNASSEARQVARKLSTYANNLNSSVYRKLSGYSGNYTGNISMAKNKTNAKITELKHKSDAYSKYANELSDLRSTCMNTDVTVKKMVSALTGNFKAAHGIKNSNVQNKINYLLTGLSNSTVAGRWLNNASDTVGSVKDYIKQSLEDWWDYEGGKQLVKGVAIGVLEVVIAVCAFIGAIASGAALIVIIAGVVGAIIAGINGIANIVNEGRGYYETHYNEEPALGRRRSNEDTVQDALRRETDSTFWHRFATGIDVVNFVCSVITFVDGAGKLIKNAYKWTTGSMAEIKNLRVKDILTKQTF